MPKALRSVMPRLAAMSRSRIPGSCARNSSTRPWLLRKPQLPIPQKVPQFPEKICRFLVADDAGWGRTGRSGGLAWPRQAGARRRYRAWSELGQLGVRRVDPVRDGAELDDHRPRLDSDHAAETIPVMRHQVLRLELLDRLRCGRRPIERASGDGTPGHGVGWFLIKTSMRPAGQSGRATHSGIPQVPGLYSGAVTQRQPSGSSQTGWTTADPDASDNSATIRISWWWKSSGVCCPSCGAIATRVTADCSPPASRTVTLPL